MKTYSLTPLIAPVTKTVRIPGSKSYTNRALLLATLTKGTVTIKNPLFSDDTKAMISCLETLGIGIETTNDTITVFGDISQIKTGDYTLDAKLSGTTVRFITALACIIPGKKTIIGEEGLQKRPITDLVDALKQLGAKIEYLGKEDYPPLSIISETLTVGNVTVKGTISSQYLSAILMIAPLIGNITITIDGEQISKPYIYLTLATMKDFGVTVTNNQYTTYEISAKQAYKKDTYTVEGDYSSAGYFFAIAALTTATITVENLSSDSKQGDKQFLSLLEYMGNHVTYAANSVTIQGKTLKALSVSLQDYPDQAQTLAVLAAFINGTTTIHGIASLRVKETERILALQTELKKMGIETESTEDSLTIFGGNPKPATIHTYGDHRMAMAFAVAGSKISGMQIVDPDVVTKTFPTFWETIRSIGIGVTTV
ncbi:MAG: 3-phosphoshikimate 1-carboxyvinyltransferase [Candidatus Levybacteria bacterium]|nr:3-phosphoshikimate 1-carboxyvinyltransferase [Candidatus Levybacteria bacterium]